MPSCPNEEINLLAPEATSNTSHAKNGNDGSELTLFALQGGKKDGYWKSAFADMAAKAANEAEAAKALIGKQVSSIQILSRHKDNEEANNARIYVGDKLCGRMPSNVEKYKLYTFKC